MSFSGRLALSGRRRGSSFCDSLNFLPWEIEVEDLWIFIPDGFHSHLSTLLSSSRIKFWRTVVKNNQVSDLAWKVRIIFDCPRGRHILSLIWSTSLPSIIRDHKIEQLTFCKWNDVVTSRDSSNSDVQHSILIEFRSNFSSLILFDGICSAYKQRFKFEFIMILQTHAAKDSSWYAAWTLLTDCAVALDQSDGKEISFSRSDLWPTRSPAVVLNTRTIDCWGLEENISEIIFLSMLIAKLVRGFATMTKKNLRC